MLQSFWEFLRHRACDAVLAGVEDAVRVLEQEASPTKRTDAANQLMSRLKSVVAEQSDSKPAAKGPANDAGKSSQPTGKSTQPGPFSADKVEEGATDTEPAPSLLESPAGHLKKTNESAFSRARGRGRNRKQEARA